MPEAAQQCSTPQHPVHEEPCLTYAFAAAGSSALGNGHTCVDDAMGTRADEAAKELVTEALCLAFYIIRVP